jgi:uncharacterized protein YceH (UPF0502 family)
VRGAQTPGELRSRAARLAPFHDVSEVETALEALATRTEGACVVRMAREPGRRESRYRHLFGGDIPQETGAHAAESDTSVPPRVETGADASILERLEALEAAVESLQRQLRSSSAVDQ